MVCIHPDDCSHSTDLISAVSDFFARTQLRGLIRCGVRCSDKKCTAETCDIGWSRPGFFDGSEDEMTLKRCIARYHM